MAISLDLSGKFIVDNVDWKQFETVTCSIKDLQGIMKFTEKCFNYSDLAIIVCPFFNSKRCGKHSACLNTELCMLWGKCNTSVLHIVKADRVLSAELSLASWHTSQGIYFLFYQPRSWQSYVRSDWLRGRFQFAAWQFLQTSMNCQSRSKCSIIWTFFFSPACAQGPVGHYRDITSEILVQTSGGKLMCWCDERFSLWVWQQEPEQGR